MSLRLTPPRSSTTSKAARITSFIIALRSPPSAGRWPSWRRQSQGRQIPSHTTRLRRQGRRWVLAALDTYAGHFLVRSKPWEPQRRTLCQRSMIRGKLFSSTLKGKVIQFLIRDKVICTSRGAIAGYARLKPSL